MAWWNKLWEKIKGAGKSAKEWSDKQWIKLKNWWKKHWKTVVTVVGAIAVVVIIVVAIYFLLPYATSTITKIDSSLLEISSETVKSLPATIKENFNPPAIISSSNDLSIKIPDLSYILRALEIRDTVSDLTNLISNINVPTPTTTSENNDGFITSIFNKKDAPHHLRQVYNCDLTINNERFNRLEISQYYKTKPGREKINDDLIRKIVESLNGKEWGPDTKKEPSNWDYFTSKDICYENNHYRLICCRENNSTTWGVLNIHPIKVKNKN